MSKKTTMTRDGSTTTWENLDEYVRLNMQTFVQNVLEEEVTEFLGRADQYAVRPSTARRATAMVTISRAA